MVRYRQGLAIYVRMLCALAVLLLGLGHQPPAFAAASLIPDVESVAMLPDGSLPELYLSGMPEKHGTVEKRCEVCRLAQAFLLPPPADLGWLRAGAAAVPPLSFRPAVAPGHDWQSAAPRGPPAPVLTV